VNPISLILVSALSLALFASNRAGAQDWPTKPLHAIVPAGPGGTTDIVCRVVFEQLSLQLKRPIAVENRPGAGATIGAAFVAKSSPDGYTILVNSNAHTNAPALYPNLSYDPSRDFASVIPLGTSPNVMVVSPAKGFKTVKDLVTAGKARPGALNYSSVGNGTASHLSAERFLLSADIAVVHIPFKGAVEAISEVMTGRVDFFFGPVGLILPYLRDGRLLPLVVNGTERAAALPEVPTTAEAGFAQAEYPIWFGVFVPVKTPRDIVDLLHREILKALQTPKVQERLIALGIDSMVLTPAEFDALVKKEIAINTALINKAGLRAR
jgi:tripartite-type tricarboxylate transporter receptor subunit TctC